MKLLKKSILSILALSFVFGAAVDSQARPETKREVRLKNQNNINSAINILNEAKGIAGGSPGADVRNSRIKMADGYLKELKLSDPKNKKFLNRANRYLTLARKHAAQKPVAAKYIDRAIARLRNIKFQRSSKMEYTYECSNHFGPDDVRQMEYARKSLRKALKSSDKNSIRKNIRQARIKIAKYQGKVCNYLNNAVQEIDTSRRYLRNKSQYGTAKEHIEMADKHIIRAMDYMTGKREK